MLAPVVAPMIIINFSWPFSKSCLIHLGIGVQSRISYRINCRMRADRYARTPPCKKKPFTTTSQLLDQNRKKWKKKKNTFRFTNPAKLTVFHFLRREMRDWVCMFLNQLAHFTCVWEPKQKRRVSDVRIYSCMCHHRSSIWMFAIFRYIDLCNRHSPFNERKRSEISRHRRRQFICVKIDFLFLFLLILSAIYNLPESRNVSCARACARGLFKCKKIKLAILRFTSICPFLLVSFL